MAKVHSTHHLVVDLLKYLGNSMPTKKQIDLMGNLLSTTYIRNDIIINDILSPREKTCLYLAALGKSAKETSVILKIKNSTVVTYRKEIMRKLGCKNMVQAVFNGVRFNLLDHTLLF